MTRIRDALLLSLLLLLASGAHAQTQSPPPDELTKEQADKLTLDAVALYRSGDSARALANLDRALAFFRRTGDRLSQDIVLHVRGNVLADKGEHAKAVEAYAESLAIMREIGGQDETGVLHEMAMEHLEMGHYADATHLFEEERGVLSRTGKRKREGEAVHNLAVVEARQHHDEQAIALFDRALAIRREVGDKEGEARTLELLAFICNRAGQLPKALELSQQALPIWRALGDIPKAEKTEGDIARIKAAMAKGDQKPRTAKQLAKSEQANELNSECSELMSRGDYAAALAKCENARDLFREAGNRRGEAMALTNAGTILIHRNEYARAQEVEIQALAIAREVGDEEDEGNALNTLALIYLNRAQYPQALTYFERTLAIERRHDDLVSAADTLGNIAAVHVALGQLDDAAREYEQLLTQPSSQADRAKTLLNLSAISHMKKEFPKARDLLQKAIAIQRLHGDPLIRTSVANLAALSVELGEYAKALELVQEALTLDRKIGDRASESGNLATMAEIQARQGEPAKALELYQQALAMARELDIPTAESADLAGIGRIQESQGKTQQAFESYQQAITIEETIRGGGQTDEIKTALAERSSDLYERAARLLIHLGRLADAFNLVERARARTFLDQLGKTGIEVHAGGAAKEIEQERTLRLALAGLNQLLTEERARPRAEQGEERIRSLLDQRTAKRREYADQLTRLKVANPEYASLISVSPLTLPEVQRLLEPDTTLLSYFITADATLAFVVTRNAFQAVELPVTEKDLGAAVDELRNFASVGGPPSPILARLYGWLAEPLLPYLKTPLVCIVPHRFLYKLPFAALLVDRRKGKWFGDAHTLFYLPTASALPFIGQKRKATRGDLLALGQGHPAGLPPLLHAEKEAEAVAALFGTRALIGPAATETAFRERAPSAGILHIAAHGELNATMPLFSRLILAPDDPSDTARDGSLEVREIYGLDLKHASLVVLSACQTQLGTQSRGDDVVGLSRAFIYAGTPAVVASLWSVDDVATASLMTSFYKHLQEGLGNAAALHAAQAETRVHYPDPYYWASFVLTGDPR